MHVNTRYINSRGTSFILYFIITSMFDVKYQGCYHLFALQEPYKRGRGGLCRTKTKTEIKRKTDIVAENSREEILGKGNQMTAENPPRQEGDVPILYLLWRGCLSELSGRPH